MNRDIAEKNVWQVQWQILVSQTGSRYRAFQGGVVRLFVKFLVDKFHGAREPRWNVERPMIFMGVIL